jgi:ACS family hexuronate transporter-like MFS transporter
MKAESTRPRSRAWLAGLFVLLFGATFLNYSQRFVFTQNTTKIQRTFTDESGTNSTDQGKDSQRNVKAYSTAASRFSLGFAFGSLLFGILADWISIRWLYPIVVLVWSIAGIASGTSETVMGLAASRFALGLFEAGHWPCALRTTQRTFLPASRTAANSILQSGASIGAVLTPLLVLYIHQRDPDAWRQSFFLVGALGLPWVIAWLLLVRESDVRRPAIQTDETSTGIGQQRELVELPLWRIFCTRRWWILLVTVICINTVWHFIRVWMTDWLENYHGYSHEFVSQFTSLYFMCTFFGSLASGGFIAWLAAKGWNVHRARLTTFLLFALLTALVVPAAFMPTGILLLGCLLVVAFGSLGLFPVYYSLNQELSARHQGKVGGSLGFSTWFILSFFHEWVGDLISDDPDSRKVVFCVVGLAPLAAFFLLHFCWGLRPEREVEQKSV